MSADATTVAPVDDTPVDMTSPPDVRLSYAAGRLAELKRRLAALDHAPGFPAATKGVDWTALLEIVAAGLLNHLHDAYTDGLYPRQAKDFEREALGWLADLFRAPADDRWGYVTSGASEAIIWALRLARQRLPKAIVVHSSASHDAVPDAIDLVAMEAVELGVDEHGEMDYADLAGQAALRRDRPIVVVANAGTTWTEAVDDVRQIHKALDQARIPARNRFIIVDAAFAAYAMATRDPADRPGFDLADGAHVVLASAHKDPGSPFPAAAVITFQSLIPPAPTVGYTRSRHTTLTSSRNGHAVLALWLALITLGVAGFAARAAQGRAVAAHLHRRLTAIGWRARRRPHAVTVVFDAPPQHVRDRFHLAEIDGESHCVCVEGVTYDLADEIVAAIAEATGRRPAATAKPAKDSEPADPAAPAETTAPNGRGSKRLFGQRAAAQQVRASDGAGA